MAGLRCCLGNISGALDRTRELPDAPAVYTQWFLQSVSDAETIILRTSPPPDEIPGQVYNGKPEIVCGADLPPDLKRRTLVVLSGLRNALGNSEELCEALAQIGRLEEATPELGRRIRHAAELWAKDVYLIRAELDAAEIPTPAGGDVTDDDSDPLEDCLSGQPLKIYLFLRLRKRWTSFDTLGEQEHFWRKPAPGDETIKRGLRRLRQELNEISTSAVSLTIDTKHRRTRLDK